MTNVSEMSQKVEEISQKCPKNFKKCPEMSQKVQDISQKCPKKFNKCLRNVPKKKSLRKGSQLCLRLEDTRDDKCEICSNPISSLVLSRISGKYSDGSKRYSTLKLSARVSGQLFQSTCLRCRRQNSASSDTLLIEPRHRMAEVGVLL